MEYGLQFCISKMFTGDADVLVEKVTQTVSVLTDYCLHFCLNSTWKNIDTIINMRYILTDKKA